MVEYEAKPSNSLATISLVLSILGGAAMCCGGLGLLFTAPAAILGFVARKQIAECDQRGMNLAMIGLVLVPWPKTPSIPRLIPISPLW